MLCDPDESDVGIDSGLIPDAGTAQDTWCCYLEGGKRYDCLLGVAEGAVNSYPSPLRALGSALLNLPLRGLLPRLHFGGLCRLLFSVLSNAWSVLTGVSFSNN